MRSVIVEIRAAEGGDDAKLLVREQFEVYRKAGSRGVFDLEVLSERPGYLVFRANGERAAETFKNEPGGHRWQRVPPTEKRGRVHTSTVTVAVMPEPSKAATKLSDRELEWRTCRGSGKGGQHRNKTETAVQLVHLPTGTSVRIDSGRSLARNKQSALMLLQAKLAAAEQTVRRERRERIRQEQVGSGMRGDKRRTIALQRDQVIDHETGRRVSAKQYMQGQIELLW